jgi:hypothetical protein
LGVAFHSIRLGVTKVLSCVLQGYALEVIGFPANHLFKGFSHDFQALTIKVGFLLSG